jgi:hypothetical protein
MAIPGPGVPNSAPSYDYSSLLGQHLTLHPAGENIHLDSFLPRKGKGTRQVALEGWGTDWLVFKFDEPFEYKRDRLEYCLIRARWFGCPIGSEFCPVFVLIDPARALSTKSQWSSKDFVFESWGKVTLNKAS